MRLQTIGGIALLAISGAALAQVASTPAEQKLTPQNGIVAGNDMLMTDNSLAGPANTMDSMVVEDALANDTAMPDNTMANATAPE